MHYFLDFSSNGPVPLTSNISNITIKSILIFYLNIVLFLNYLRGAMNLNQVIIDQFNYLNIKMANNINTKELVVSLNDSALSNLKKLRKLLAEQQIIDHQKNWLEVSRQALGLA